MGRTSDARQRLMDAAYDLIWEHSYGAVTIDAICQRAGVKKGSFYYFFDSKSDLAVAAIDVWWAERLALIKEAFRPEVAPLDRIRTYLDFVSARQLENHDTKDQVLGCPIFTLGSEIATQDETIRRRIEDILATGAKFFESAISDAQKTGDLEPGDAPLKARMLLGFYGGTLIQARISKNPEILRTLTEDAMKFLGAKLVLVA